MAVERKLAAEVGSHEETKKKLFDQLREMKEKNNQLKKLHC